MSWLPPRTRGDDAKLLDELGDVLFQVHFLSLLLEERGAGSLADVAEHVRQKLIRRHPHVSIGACPGDQTVGPDDPRGKIVAQTAGQVLRNWDAIKATEPGREAGIFGEVPENLPGPLYARKVQRRAATSGFDFDHVPYDAVEGELEELRAAEGDREAAFHEVGDVLFAAVNVARKLKVDPELALRAAAERFRGPRAGCGRPRRRRRQRLAGSGTRGAARLLRPRTPERGALLSQIETVHARQILDSRGNPTVEVDLAAALGRPGTRRGAVRRLDRRVRGDRAARRRRRLRRQGRHQGRRQRQRRDRRRGARRRRARPVGARPGADRPRRHAEQVAPRRQRDPRRLARRGARGGRRGEPAAVALPRRRERRACCPCR